MAKCNPVYKGVRYENIDDPKLKEAILDDLNTGNSKIEAIDEKISKLQEELNELESVPEEVAEDTKEETKEFTFEDLAKENKGKTVTVKYDKYKESFKAVVTGNLETVMTSEERGILYRYVDIELRTNTGKLITANPYYEIKGLSGTENLKPESGILKEEVETQEERKKLTDSSNYKVTSFKPTAEQQIAVDKVTDFIEKNDGKGWFTLEGKAGTGKTSIVKKIIEQFPGKQINIAALSHKAKGVIETSIKEEDAVPNNVNFNTLASLLGMKMNLETGEFIAGSSQLPPPVSDADIIIIDEASMINEEALENIQQLKQSGTPLIFLGDIGQLPPIRKLDSDEANKDSKVFDTKDNTKLLTRIRQGEASPILPFADLYWDNTQSTNPELDPNSTNRESILNEEGNLVFTDSTTMAKKLESEFALAIKNYEPNRAKIVAYKNVTRKDINKYMHSKLFKGGKEVEPGELLMFSDSYEEFNNSDEIQVPSEVEESTFTVQDKSFSGFVFYVESPEADNPPIRVEMLDSKSKAKHGALVSSLFNKARVEPNRRNKGELFEEAWRVKNMFANLDYAYAITSHKSQGSTYNTVAVMEDDIMSVGPISNKQKSQSMYTAITRAKNNTLIVSSKNTNPTKNFNIIEGTKPIKEVQETPIKQDLPSLKKKLDIWKQKPGFSLELNDIIGKENTTSIVEGVKDKYEIYEEEKKKLYDMPDYSPPFNIWDFKDTYLEDHPAAKMPEINKKFNEIINVRKKQEDRVKQIEDRLKDIIIEKVLSKPQETPTKQEGVKQEYSNLEPAFTGNVSQEMFDENDVMVFGANKGGFHGYGTAGLAYTNDTRHYKNWKDINLPADTKANKVGDFAIAGKTGLMEGNKGTGYGLVTVEKPGQPLDYIELGSNIEKLYNVARENPSKRFIVPYNTDKNANKKSLNELANAFGSRLIPTNIGFSDNMLAEIKRVKGTKVFEEAEIKQEETVEVKEDVQTVFKENPELAEIGSEEEYSKYIETVFPESKHQEIVYHGTTKENIDQIMSSGFSDNLENKNKWIEEEVEGGIAEGLFFTTSPEAVAGGALDYGEEVISAILNVKDFVPETKRENALAGKPIKDGKDSFWKAASAKGNLVKDTFKEHIEYFDGPGLIAVKSPDQVHVLGSKKDIQGFKEFTSKGKVDNTDRIEKVQGKIDKLQQERDDLNKILKLDDTDLMNLNDPNGIKYFSNDPELKGPRWNGKDGDESATLPGQVFLPHNILKSIPGHENMSGRELLEVIGKENLEGLIGYRIPNQGFSSIDSLEIVGVLPKSYGDMIMTYTEVPAKTGSDFDVDKMFVMMPNLKYNKKTGKVEMTQFDNDTSEKGTQKRYNKYVNKYTSKKYGKELDAMLKEDHVEDWKIVQENIKILNDLTEMNKDVTEDERYQRVLNDIIEIRTSKLKWSTIFEEKKKEVIASGEVDSLDTYSKQTIYEQNSKEAVQNRLLELYNSIMTSDATHSEAVSSLDADYLKEDAYVTSYIATMKGKPEQHKEFLNLPYEEQVKKATSELRKTSDAEFYDPMHQFKVKRQNAAGKTGTGQMSNHLVHHVYGQQSKLGVRQDLGLGAVTDLSQIYTLDGTQKINQVLSAYLNAYVDNAKDPYIAMINNNAYTANTVAYLLRAGVSYKQVNSIMSQPIIKRLVQNHNLSQSKLTKSEFKKRSVLSIGLETVDVKEKNTTNTAITDTIEFMTQQMLNDPNPSEGELKNTMSLTANNTVGINELSMVKLDNALTRPRDYDFYTEQLSILNFFLRAREGAKVLSNTMKVTKADTNGAYGSFIEQLGVEELHRKLVDEGNVENLDKLFANTSSGAYTKNTLHLSNAIYGDKMLYKTEGFREVLRGVYQSVGEDPNYLVNDDINQKVANDYYRYISSATPLFQISDTKRKDLFEKLPTRLKEAKKKYTDNVFIQDLYTTFDRSKGMNFIKIDASKIADVDANDLLTRAWLHALEADDSDLKELATDLVTYSFFSSGFKKSRTSFFELIPMSWFDKNEQTDFTNTYNETIGSLKESVGPDNKFMKQLAQHNPLERKIVKSLSSKVKNKLISKPGQNLERIIMEKDIPTNYKANSVEGKDAQYVQFISAKVRENENSTVVTPYLYQFKGVDTSEKHGKGFGIIYERIPILGYSEKGNNMVEYNYRYSPNSIVNKGGKVVNDKVQEADAYVPPTSLDIVETIPTQGVKFTPNDSFKSIYDGGNTFSYEGIDAEFGFSKTTNGGLKAYVKKVNGKEIEIGLPAEVVGSFDTKEILLEDVTTYLNEQVGKTWLEHILNTHC